MSVITAGEFAINLVTVRAAEEAANSGGSLMDNLEWMHVFGLVILGFAAICLAMQFVAIVKPSAGTSQEAKKKLQEAADNVEQAADKTLVAASNLTGAREMMMIDSGPRYNTLRSMDDDAVMLIRQIAEQEEAVETDAAEAKEQAVEAKKEVNDSGTSLTDLANTVAGKFPLVGAALLFTLVGAWVGGFVTIELG